MTRALQCRSQVFEPPVIACELQAAVSVSDAVGKGSYGHSVALAVEIYRVSNRVYVPVS